jgi:hypothetical protein
MINGEEIMFADGEELSKFYFDKSYMVQSIEARESIVFLKLIENCTNKIDFQDQDQVSFF